MIQTDCNTWPTFGHRTWGVKRSHTRLCLTLRPSSEQPLSSVNPSPKLRSSKTTVRSYLSINNNRPLRFTTAILSLPNSKRWSLHGMTALVIGGTCGIGHAIVEELAGLGAKVHTCARTETELKRCLGDWEDEGFGVTGSVCDVLSCPQQEELMDSVFSIFNGKLNILINNVGTNIRKPMIEFIPKNMLHSL